MVRTYPERDLKMYLQLTTRCNMACEHCAFACTSKGVDISLEDAKTAIDEAADHGDTLTIGGGEPTLHPQFWEIMAYAIEQGQNVAESWAFIITNGKRTEDALALAWLAETCIIGAELSRDEWHDPVEWEVVEAFMRKNLCGWKGLRHVPKCVAEALGYDETAWMEDAMAYEAEEAEYEDREPREIDPESVLESFWEMKSCELQPPRSPHDLYPPPTMKGYRTVTNIAARGRAKDYDYAEDRCVCEGIFVAADATVWQCGCKRLKIADSVNGDFYGMTPNHTECSESEWFQEALEMQEAYS